MAGKSKFKEVQGKKSSRRIHLRVEAQFDCGNSTSFDNDLRKLWFMAVKPPQPVCETRAAITSIEFSASSHQTLNELFATSTCPFRDASE
jgi:hypothetical protein